jgi:hypothetical protein
LLGLCLDSLDYKKVRSYMPLNVVSFLSSGILTWMPLELMRRLSSISQKVISSWVFYFPINPYYWTDVRYLAPWWVFPDGCQRMVLRYFNSALQARKQMRSYLSLVHESLKYLISLFGVLEWCSETSQPIR